MRFPGGLLLACFLLPLPLSGGTSPKVIQAVRTDAPVTLDGLLHDWRWLSAPPAEDFTQFYPDEGAEPTERTSIRILYDDNAIYIGVICYDSEPRGIVPQLTRRDRSSEADRFTVQIDSYHDHQTAFVFSTNVAGVQSDGFLSQDGNAYDLNYDAVWQVATARHSEGWSAEFLIPYNAFRFAAQDDGHYTWGINFRRYISRKRETVEWVMVPSTERLLISKWGHVTGINNITPPLNLSVIPYVSGTMTFETAASYRPYRSDKSAGAGLDLKYGVSRNFTLDAAFNPDFGQVEVDQAILNLTVFETFYPEKRPFFVEGASIFDFGTAVDNRKLRLFFSRRVGKRPTGAGAIAAPPGGSVVDNPLITTIYGAAKVTGKTESGFSVGILSAATAEEQGTVRDSTGVETKTRTEPGGMYNVLRLKQEFGGNSWIGAMATATGRETMLPAFSGGVDWNLRFGSGTYTLDGFLAGATSSRITGIRDGSAGKLLFSRISAEHWYYSVGYDFYSRHFNPNDAGFFAQPHDHGMTAQLLYRENRASGLFRRFGVSLSTDARWNWNDIRTLSLMELSFTSDWMNFWRSTLQYTYFPASHDDTERGYSGIRLRPVSHHLQLHLTTDERLPVSASAVVDVKTDEKKKSSFGGLIGLTLRPTSWIELTPLVYYERTRDEEAGVFNLFTGRIETQSGRSVIGDRDLDELDIALRGTLTFTRTLSLQFYTQILLPRGRYKNFRRLDGPSTLTPVTLQQSNFDFNITSFAANVLLRWEYLPGSTLFLVWTQSRDDFIPDYRIDFGPRFRETFKLPHDDAVLLKVSYWLPL